MAKLIKKVISASTGGLVGGKKKKTTSSAEAQARAVGATLGSPSEKAQAASKREFAAPTVSSILGGPAGPGFGRSSPGYRRRPLKRSR